MRRLKIAAALSVLAVFVLAAPAWSRERQPELEPLAEEGRQRRELVPGLDLGAGTTETKLGEPGAYLHLIGGAGLGRGLRLNNPYRLRTYVGDDAEGLSLSATYLDLSLGGALGPARGLQHGAVLHLSIATDGIAQEVLSASYLALYPFGTRFRAFARAGVPVVLEPDLNAGFELALGGALLVSSGVGLSAELVGSLFYGAATIEQSASVIPLLSFQAGVWVDYEVLP